MTALAERLRRAVPATPAERAAALWSFGYFFMLLASYYVLRPLRDRMAIEADVKALPWLFTATFVTLLALQPVYGALVATLSRGRFVPIVYQFFAANLLAFWVLLALDVGPVVVARVFFVWVSVFNLFAVAVFWSVMADLFTSEQGKRLFGFIGAGGTAGGLLGPLITIVLSVPLGPHNLLLVALVLLEFAVLCVARLERIAGAEKRGGAHGDDGRVGGSMLAGLAEVLRSRYLLAMAAWVALQSFGATVLYLEQAQIVANTVHGGGEQTRLFAGVDLAVGILTLATQVLATGRVLSRFGTGAAAASLPLIYFAGFAVLAAAPAVAVVLAFQVVQRWVNFAIANPARQVFFTVVDREAKYKAKSVIDVVVYRGADAASGWLFDSLQALGLKLGAIALGALPVAAAWAMLSRALGRMHDQRAAREGATVPAPP